MITCELASPEYIEFQVNISGKTRRAVQDGRNYLVAPITIIVPGVLNGSSGAVYYPQEHVRKSAARWDGMPITRGHPKVNGKYVSARYPGILATHGLGFLKSTVFRHKLVTEGWFDEEKTRQVDKRIYDALLANQPMEVSTGLHAVKVPAPAGSVDSKGKSYTHIAVEYDPDHLAVLPDEVGACSLKDGCGMMVNNRYDTATWVEFLLVNPYPHEHAARMIDPGQFLKDSFRRKDVSPGISVILGKKKRGGPMIVQAYRFDSAKFTPAEARTWLKKHGYRTIMFEPATRNASTEVGMKYLPTAMPVEQVENYDKSVKDKFTSLGSQIMERFGRESYMLDMYDDYVVFSRDGKTFRIAYDESDDGVCTLSEDKPSQVQRVTVYEPIENTNRRDDMALSANDRATIIDFLTANCECWKHQGDRELLATFNDEKLTHLKQAAEREQQVITVANAAVTGFQDGNGVAYRLNPETGKWESAKLGKRHGADAEDRGQPPAGGDVQNTGSSGSPPSSPKKPMTFEEIIRNSPPEIQSRFQSLLQQEQIEKARLVDHLLSNSAIDPAERPVHQERLYQKPLEELQYLVSLLPKITANQNPDQRQSARQRRAQKERDSDILVAPTINWQEVKEQTVEQEESDTRRPQAPLITIENELDDEQSYEEWVRNAPPRLRAELQSATVIVEREKRRLIEELTANITDEEVERRIVSRLASKTLDELRDLVALSPKQNQRASYFGAATPPLGNTRNSQQSSFDANEDVLPLPTINWREQA